ncbi:MAG: carboxypeptidase M32 [Pirellulales bacterium]|nr:carboxypeptidase M32 [Pirellulales bacterium]
MTELNRIYEQLLAHCRETALLSSIESLLGWDERTLLPAAAGEYRAEQMTFLAGSIHRRRTDPRIGEWLNALAADQADRHSDRGATIRELKRQYDRQVKLPPALVEEMARTAVLGQQAWVAARANNDFSAFRPHLEKTYKLKREAAQAIGYAQCAYDALLDEFEPGALTSQIASVLADLRDQLVPLVAEIRDSGRRQKIEILARHYPRDVQERFAKGAATEIGFDFHRGRLDVTHHPFCSGMGPNDCRITTRYDEHHFSGALFGVLHEAGHGIYDQGLRGDWYGLPPGEAVSLGIHESQSRMWENLVGRGLAFWQHFYSTAQQAFPAALGDVSLDDFYGAINDVRPSLIRVEADEATYNLHILVRFELEQALVADDLQPADLPGAWNEKYRHYLGIVPPNDADGVLQDIHWSAGLVGYFPTYSLGNLYAAQFFEQADADLGGLANQFAAGQFEPLRHWLREKIHRLGQCYTAGELVQRVTGESLSPAPLMRHLRGKFGRLYGLIN